MSRGDADPTAEAVSDRTRSDSNEVEAPVRQLTEALTAIGNYLSVANQILTKTIVPEPDALRAVIQKSLIQYSRAADATRKINSAIRCEEEDEDLFLLSEVRVSRRDWA